MKGQIELKVCSCPRSGTNFLMASLHYNFIFPHSEPQELYRPTVVFKLGDVVLNRNYYWVPWNYLFLMHLPWDGRIDKDRIIYIYRDFEGTYNSVKEFNYPNTRCNLFNDTNDVETCRIEHHEHIKGYMDAGCYCIRYEDLRDNFENTLTRLRDHFNLKMRQECFLLPPKLGWFRKGTIDDAMG